MYTGSESCCDSVTINGSRYAGVGDIPQLETSEITYSVVQNDVSITKRSITLTAVLGLERSSISNIPAWMSPRMEPVC